MSKTRAHCAFCGKLKAWRSNIQIVVHDRNLLCELTVCPKCRKVHTVQDLYKKSGEAIRARAGF